MKVKFAATFNAPDYYEFNGKVVTAFYKGKSESIDLSGLEYGDKVYGIVFENLTPLRTSHILRSVYVDQSGELFVELAQKCPQIEGHWWESDWIDSFDYDKDKLYIVELDKPHPELFAEPEDV